MFAGNAPPHWLSVLAVSGVVAGFLSATVILVDILNGHRQRMSVMNAAWPITGLYLGPVALWAYWSFGRTSVAQASPKGSDRPFWEAVFAGASHCGAGCTLGDFAGEWFVFLAGFSIGASVLLADFAVDFAFAYIAGIGFQYYAIAPMRNISGWPAILAAVKADTVSLIAFEIGMFGWMWFAATVLFQPRSEATSFLYWFSMQIAMIAGFATAYPANWWLIQIGWKEKM